MKFIKAIKSPTNTFFCVLILLFFLAPALEESRLVFVTSPFAISLVSILALRVVSMRQKHFWSAILLVGIGFFLDLILTFTFEPFLEGALTIAVRMIYITVFFVTFILLVKRLLTATTDGPVVSFKIGVCGYLLIGVLWSIIYALIFFIDRGSLSAQESAQLPFFYFSYSVLTGLRFSTVFPLNLWSTTLCFLESITGSVFLVVFTARMAVSFIKHHMYL